MRTGCVASVLALALAGCVAEAPPADQPPPGRPLETLPAGARLQQVETDLLDTARKRFGDAALTRALAAPTHLIVKRFVGMAPPPPPGAGADWRPPTPNALVIREEGKWYAATDGGWRPASEAAIAELEPILASEAFRSESATVPACPDFGASNLLLKAPGRARIVRSHQCSSATTRAIEAAFRA